MYNFGRFLQELSVNTGIDFNLIDEDGNHIYHSNLKVEKSQCISYLITVGNGKANLRWIILIDIDYNTRETLIILNTFSEI